MISILKYGFFIDKKLLTLAEISNIKYQISKFKLKKIRKERHLLQNNFKK